MPNHQVLTSSAATVAPTAAIQGLTPNIRRLRSQQAGCQRITRKVVSPGPQKEKARRWPGLFLVWKLSASQKSQGERANDLNPGWRT
ncbi:hypothetical protein [Arenimonas alkanexedens]